MTHYYHHDEAGITYMEDKGTHLFLHVVQKTGGDIDIVATWAPDFFIAHAQAAMYGYVLKTLPVMEILYQLDLTLAERTASE